MTPTAIEKVKLALPGTTTRIQRKTKLPISTVRKLLNIMKSHGEAHWIPNRISRYGYQRVWKQGPQPLETPFPTGSK